MVVANNVIGVGDPDTSRCLISIEKTPRATHIYDKVAFDQVLRFRSVFNENGVTHSVVSYVVLDAKVVHSVYCHSPVERVMDGVIAHVGRVHGTNHVEMNRVAT